MWTYSQSTGELRGVEGALIATGYSGRGEHKNDPDSQEIENEGPIPRGRWLIVAVFDSPTHGPFCLRLLPQIEMDTFGRSGFLIHGDSAAHPGEASQGCIILPRKIREYIWGSADRFIEVIV
jgi:hypothetical protein